MKIDERITAMHGDLTGWRRDLHAHPELGFEEHRTSDFVARKLEEFGLEVHRGIAKTGVVGVLRAGHGGNQAIGLRADMDALPINEANDIPYKSTAPGKMHACGHDGHTTMLLGAARYLAETKRFDGTAYFIFQPAEETAGGGRVMVEEGLLDRFPMSAVYGMHNWPGLAVGSIGAVIGPVMASMDTFEIAVTGLGSHAAMPHLGRDPIVAGANLVSTLQTIASRSIAPTDAVVVSVTQFHAGDAWNVIPETVNIRGTVRTLDRNVQKGMEPALRRICEGLAHAHGIAMDLTYTYGYPVTVNTAAETEFAREVAGQVVGADNVRPSLAPSMGAEDFAFMLEKRPGCYVWVGNGPTDGGRILHNPHYDFNDDILPIGVAYWGELVERALPARG
jgi:amidohydrolase